MDRHHFRFEDFDFTKHFEACYGKRGQTYFDYEFAYHFGYELALTDRYNDAIWLVVQHDARALWSKKHPGRDWVAFRDAVRFAWQATTTFRQHGWERRRIS